MSVAQNAITQLNAFADAESVKEFLKLMGVKGYRQDEMSCPISQWVGHLTNCAVATEYTIKVYNSTGPNWIDDPEEYSTSDAVKQFITNFDLGQYPELDADDVEEDY